ncbi:MAG: insulinase family protein [Anaerolineales bacterium]|nr:MAG: insulinase family protein [Anaerolineales bacterium]
MKPTTVEESLENGLKIILREAHAAPVVSTWIWYRVGSRNEVGGCTGISHWVEHMMFKGSHRFPKGAIMRAVNRHGGYLNAMTSRDFTTYYETLPADRAELSFRIEADRMVGADFDPGEVAAERTVVIAEREGSENEPRYVLAEEVCAAAFRVHPYHHQTIGWKADLLNITRDQLYAHYRQYYAPNNALLVTVGDFCAAAQLDLIRRHFADLPRADLPTTAVSPEPSQRGERRVTVRMPGSAPLVHISYHTPPVSHPDYLPLVVLDAVLSGGRAMFAFGDSQARSARLYRALVETGLAASAGSSYHPSLDPFLLSMGATVRDERDPSEVERALLAEISKLQQHPVQQRELAVAIRQTQAQFAYSSESVSSQALTLGFLDMVDTYERMDTLLQELAQVSPADIRRVAQTYLTEDNRVVGLFRPTKQGSRSTMNPSGPPNWSAPNRGMFAYLSPSHKPSISPETITRRRLDNGMVVLVHENPASVTVAVEGSIQAGSSHETDATAGLASLTASMLRRGTDCHTFQEINAALDDVGASLEFSSGRDDMSFAGRALAEDFDLLAGLLAEMLARPAFPRQELEKLRGQILTRLGILDTDTGYRANRAFMASLYPTGHPYSRPAAGTRETVSSLAVGDLARFHRAYYHPETLVISLVGAVRAEHAIEKLSATLGRWHVETSVRPRTIPIVETPPGIISKRVPIPAKAQVHLIWGVVGMARTSPDYYPAMMANLVLGRLGLMGRLGERVRDDQGLAYYVTSSLRSSPGPRPWSIVAGVNPRNVDRAVESILEEVERLRDEPIRDAELDDSRTFLTGALPLHLETNAGIASFLMAIEEFDLGLDYLLRYPDIIASITKEDIHRVVRKYLTLDRYALTMAGTFDLPPSETTHTGTSQPH